MSKIIEKWKEVCYNCQTKLGKARRKIVAEQKKLIFGNIAYATIEGRKKGLKKMRE